MSMLKHVVLTSFLFLPGYLPAFTLVVDHGSVESKKNRVTPTVSMGRIDSVALRFGADTISGFSKYQLQYESSVISTNSTGSTNRTEELTLSMIRTLRIEEGGFRFASAGVSTWNMTNPVGTTDSYLGIRLTAGGVSHLINRFFSRAALDVDLQYPFGSGGELIDMRYGVKARIGVMYGFHAAELAFSYGYRSSIFKFKNGDSLENISFGPMFTLRVTM